MDHERGADRFPATGDFSLTAAVLKWRPWAGMWPGIVVLANRRCRGPRSVALAGFGLDSLVADHEMTYVVTLSFVASGGVHQAESPHARMRR